MSVLSDVGIVLLAASKDSLQTIRRPIRTLKVIFGKEPEPTVSEKIAVEFARQKSGASAKASL
jgi:hypothetical protein